MSNIPSSAQYIQLQAAQQRASTSEFLAQTIGGSINYLLDQTISNNLKISIFSGALVQNTSPFGNTITGPSGTIHGAFIFVNLAAPGSILTSFQSAPGAYFFPFGQTGTFACGDPLAPTTEYIIENVSWSGNNLVFAKNTNITPSGGTCLTTSGLVVFLYSAQ